MPARHNEVPDANNSAVKKDGGPGEAVAFIAETLTQLRAICERHRLDTLGYLIDMAHLEAREIEYRARHDHR